jgi:hypothetical protein
MNDFSQLPMDISVFPAEMVSGTIVFPAGLKHLLSAAGLLRQGENR